MSIVEKLSSLGFSPKVLPQIFGTECAEIAVDEWLRTAEALKNHLSFEYLVSIIGVDYKEEGIGAFYRFYSYKNKQTFTAKVLCKDRENALLPTITHLWKSAALEEREVYDFFGIHFLNNKDMRRLYLRSDWKGFPLRKDYDDSEELNPIPQNPEHILDYAPEFHAEENSSSATEIDRDVFEKDAYVVNIGPQHPATHGVLHFQVALESEIVKKVDVHCGYIHRGVEKLSESLSYPQILAFTDRLDYISASINRHALCACVEEAAEIEIPKRVEYIRLIMDELTRIESHLLFYSTFCMDMGGLTPFFYGFRDREKILNIFEDSSGGRLIQNYNMIGGLAADVHKDFFKNVADFIKYLPTVLDEYHKVFTGNVIAQNRTKGVGVLSTEDACSYAITGPSARASNLSCDIRKHRPYSLYNEFEFNEILRSEGDCFARYMLRMDEIMESIKIIEQALAKTPTEGEYCVKTKPIIKLPEGVYYKAVEAARGEFGVFIESKGDKSPYRIKFRSTGLPLVGVVDHLSSNGKIADLIAIGGTLDYIVPDIDR